MQSRDKIKRAAIKNKTPPPVSFYKHIRNNINKLNSDPKKQYFSEIISKAKGIMKE